MSTERWHWSVNDLEDANGKEVLHVDHDYDGATLVCSDDARRYIEAAPEMLKSLQELLFMLASYHALNDPALLEAKALIAKVRGAE